MTRLLALLILLPALAGCGGIFEDPETNFLDANSVKFTPDGRKVISGYFITTITEDDEGGSETETSPMIHLHDAATGFVERRTRFGDGVWELDVSPDGRLIASADEDKKVRLYELQTGLLVRELTGHSEGAFSVAFSPDGALVASGGRDWRIRLWNAATGALVRTLTGHQEAVYNVEFSPDGRLLASSGATDGTVRFWDALNGSHLSTFDTGKSFVTDLDFSPNGKTLAIGAGRSVLLYDVEAGVQVRELTEHGGQVNAAAFSPDGAHLATGGGQGDFRVRIWDTNTFTVTRELEGHRSQILTLAWSPDGSRIASGSSDGTIRMWNSETSQELWQFK